RLLKGYFEHMKKNPDSFLTRYYGLFSMTMYGSTLYFTVMKNVFVPGLEPHEKYDIKGSWVNRHTKHHIELGVIKLMKDQDLHKSLLLDLDISHKIYGQISKDTKFLEKNNIMDYSLLLGFYNVGIASQHFNQNKIPFFLKKKKKSNNNNKYIIYIYNIFIIIIIIIEIAEHGVYQPPTVIRKGPSYGTEEQVKQQVVQLVEIDNSPLRNGGGANTLSCISTPSEKQMKPLDLRAANLTNTHTNPASDTATLDGDLNKKMFGRHELQLIRRRAVTTGTGLKVLDEHLNTYQTKIVEGAGFYSFGVIDILQDWNLNKKWEHFLKVYVFCKEKHGVSCIEPHKYRQRFLYKMQHMGLACVRFLLLIIVVVVFFFYYSCFSFLKKGFFPLAPSFLPLWKKNFDQHTNEPTWS
ncbi:1-phosphatidylinositol-4-phosphate 5-kinase, partial [Reticulomyxa filosa]